MAIMTGSGAREISDGLAHGGLVRTPAGAQLDDP